MFVDISDIVCIIVSITISLFFCYHFCTFAPSNNRLGIFLGLPFACWLCGSKVYRPEEHPHLFHLLNFKKWKI